MKPQAFKTKGAKDDRATARRAPLEQTPPAAIAPRSDVSRVLAPVDFKDDSVADVRAAAALARSLRVPLLLVHVVAPLKAWSEHVVLTWEAHHN